MHTQYTWTGVFFWQKKASKTNVVEYGLMQPGYRDTDTYDAYIHMSPYHDKWTNLKQGACELLRWALQISIKSYRWHYPLRVTSHTLSEAEQFGKRNTPKEMLRLVKFGQVPVRNVYPSLIWTNNSFVCQSLSTKRTTVKHLLTLDVRTAHVRATNTAHVMGYRDRRILLVK